MALHFPDAAVRLLGISATAYGAAGDLLGGLLAHLAIIGTTPSAARADISRQAAVTALGRLGQADPALHALLTGPPDEACRGVTGRRRCGTWTRPAPNACPTTPRPFCPCSAWNAWSRPTPATSCPRRRLCPHPYRCRRSPTTPRPPRRPFLTSRAPPRCGSAHTDARAPRRRHADPADPICRRGVPSASPYESPHRHRRFRAPNAGRARPTQATSAATHPPGHGRHRGRLHLRGAGDPRTAGYTSAQRAGRAHADGGRPGHVHHHRGTTHGRAHLRRINADRRLIGYPRNRFCERGADGAVGRAARRVHHRAGRRGSAARLVRPEDQAACPAAPVLRVPAGDPAVYVTLAIPPSATTREVRLTGSLRPWRTAPPQARLAHALRSSPRLLGGDETSPWSAGGADTAASPRSPIRPPRHRRSTGTDPHPAASAAWWRRGRRTAHRCLYAPGSEYFPVPPVQSRLSDAWSRA